MPHIAFSVPDDVETSSCVVVWHRWLELRTVHINIYINLELVQNYIQKPAKKNKQLRDDDDNNDNDNDNDNNNNNNNNNKSPANTGPLGGSSQLVGAE